MPTCTSLPLCFYYLLYQHTETSPVQVVLKRQNDSEFCLDLVALTTCIDIALFCPHLAFEIMGERKIPFPHEAKRFVCLFVLLPTIFFAMFCSFTGESIPCLPMGILRK